MHKMHNSSDLCRLARYSAGDDTLPDNQEQMQSGSSSWSEWSCYNIIPPAVWRLLSNGILL